MHFETTVKFRPGWSYSEVLEVVGSEFNRVSFDVLPTFRGTTWSGVTLHSENSMIQYLDYNNGTSLYGEYYIKDIYAYMNALSNFKNGDETTVVILRNGKEIEFKVKF